MHCFDAWWVFTTFWKNRIKKNQWKYTKWARNGNICRLMSEIQLKIMTHFFRFLFRELLLIRCQFDSWMVQHKQLIFCVLWHREWYSTSDSLDLTTLQRSPLTSFRLPLYIISTFFLHGSVAKRQEEEHTQSEKKKTKTTHSVQRTTTCMDSEKSIRTNEPRILP